MLRVKDWDRHFENNRTRELKSLTWVPVPNKQDGDGYTALLCDHPAGISHLGAWLVILEVASKCDPRGTLARQGGGGHTAKTLSRITRCPLNVMEEAIPRLLQIGWLEEISQEGAIIPQEGAPRSQGSAYGREGNGREGKGREKKGREEEVCSEPQAAAEPAMTDWSFPIRGPDGPEWSLPAAKLAEYVEAYPDLDMVAALKRARQWLRDNPSKRKTARGMTAYLGRWLAGDQDRGRNRVPDGLSDKERRNVSTVSRLLEDTDDEQ